MSTTTVLQDSQVSLGMSVPPFTAHAISVSLPTWRDNVGYEEGEKRVVDAMVSGYPRFFIHLSIRKVRHARVYSARWMNSSCTRSSRGYANRSLAHRASNLSYALPAKLPSNVVHSWSTAPQRLEPQSRYVSCSSPFARQKRMRLPHAPSSISYCSRKIPSHLPSSSGSTLASAYPPASQTAVCLCSEKIPAAPSHLYPQIHARPSSPVTATTPQRVSASRLPLRPPRRPVSVVARSPRRPRSFSARIISSTSKNGMVGTCPWSRLRRRRVPCVAA